MTLVKWTPMNRPGRRNSWLSPLSSARWTSDVDQLFNSLFKEPLSGLPATSKNVDWLPAFDVVEKDKEYQLRVEAAGMKKSDFSVSVKDGVLTITGEKQTEADDDSDNYAHRESCYGRFSRSFRLPDDVLNEKKVAAKYKDGVLTISLPRTKPVEIAGIEVEIK